MSGEALTWAAVLLEAADRLGPARRHEARWLVERATGYEGSEHVNHLGDPVATRHLAHFDAMLERRLAGEPLQYVLGRWQFRSLELIVDARVLIPRPETEIVAELAIAETRRRGDQAEPAVVVDLGTGSGAIALSVLTEVPRAEVWATDISRDALDVASANLAGIGRRASRLTLCHGSWFDALPSALRGRVDVIVSNPPYIASDATLPEEVAGFEPHQALFSGALGFDDLEHLIAGAPGWLRPGGTLVLELSPEQADAACAAARDAGLRAPTVHPDLTGRLRALVAHAAVAHAA